MNTVIEQSRSLATKLFIQHFGSAGDPMRAAALMATIQDLDNASGEYLEHTEANKLKRVNVVHSINQVKQILWALHADVTAADNGQ